MLLQPFTTSAINALRPARKDRVIDLVRAADLDVSDWSNSSRGAPGRPQTPIVPTSGSSSISATPLFPTSGMS